MAAEVSTQRGDMGKTASHYLVQCLNAEIARRFYTRDLISQLCKLVGQSLVSLPREVNSYDRKFEAGGECSCDPAVLSHASELVDIRTLITPFTEQ